MKWSEKSPSLNNTVLMHNNYLEMNSADRSVTTIKAEGSK